MQHRSNPRQSNQNNTMTQLRLCLLETVTTKSEECSNEIWNKLWRGKTTITNGTKLDPKKSTLHEEQQSRIVIGPNCKDSIKQAMNDLGWTTTIKPLRYSTTSFELASQEHCQSRELRGGQRRTVQFDVSQVPSYTNSPLKHYASSQITSPRRPCHVHPSLWT